MLESTTVTPNISIPIPINSTFFKNFELSNFCLPTKTFTYIPANKSKNESIKYKYIKDIFITNAVDKNSIEFPIH